MIARLPGRRSRGFTLIEMVLVIGGVTAVLGMVGALVHLLLRLDRQSRNYLNDSMAVSRLADQFRDDVHDAEKAEPKADKPADKASLLLTMPESRTVTYSWDGPVLNRDESISGERKRHESYRVDRLSPIRFDVKEGFVEVVLGREPDVASAAFRSRIRIEASVGKHRKLGRAGEKKS